MMRPRALGTPAEMHTSTCPSFMLTLHANWALHAHTKALLHTHLQLTHISQSRHRQAMWPPTILFTFNYSCCNVSCSKPRKNGRWLKNIRRHWKTQGNTFNWLLQCRCSVFNTWPKLALGARVSPLIARCHQERSHPNCSHFQGSWSSQVLSNGHHSEPSYRSRISAPKIGKCKNSTDWATPKWNYL